MTEPTPASGYQQNTKRNHSAAPGSRELSFQSTYLCPVCRHGHITAMTLMDAFSCDFCRHIFTTNLVEQTVQVVDSSQPMSWRWTGRNWRVAYRDEFDLTVVIWVVGLLLVALPSTIVWLATYTFPPLPNSKWAWFPMIWVGCTFFIHFSMVIWLLAEHYQLPFYVAGKIRLRHLFDRR